MINNNNKFFKRKGSALFDYALVLILFALPIGLTIFEMSPDILKTYFEKSVDNHAVTADDGTLTMKTMGE